MIQDRSDKSTTPPSPEPATGTPPSIPFEAALDRLQQTVKKLESGELSLEDSLKGFEEGVRLTRVCQEYLSAAERRVEILMKSSMESAEAKPEFQPFQPDRPIRG